METEKRCTQDQLGTVDIAAEPEGEHCRKPAGVQEAERGRAATAHAAKPGGADGRLRPLPAGAGQHDHHRQSRGRVQEVQARQIRCLARARGHRQVRADGRHQRREHKGPRRPRAPGPL